MLNYFRSTVLLLICVSLYYVYFSEGVDRILNERRATVPNGPDPSTGVVRAPAPSSLHWTSAGLVINWDQYYATGSASGAQYISIDLYNSARPIHFFITQIVDKIPLGTNTFNWTMPSSIPTGTSYVIRVWSAIYPTPLVAPFFFQLPDSHPFTIARDPLGVSLPYNGLSPGGVDLIFYFTNDAVVSPATGVFLSLFDPTSSDPMYRNGIIIASNLVSTTNDRVNFNVPPNLPNSNNWKYRAGAIATKTNTIIWDQCPGFQIAGGWFDKKLTIALSAQGTYKSGNQISFTVAYNGNVPYTQFNVLLYSSDRSSPNYNIPFVLAKDVVVGTQNIINWQIPALSGTFNYYAYVFGHKDDGTGVASATGSGFSIQSDTTAGTGSFTSPSSAGSITAGIQTTVSWTSDSPASSWNLDLYQNTGSEIIFITNCAKGINTKSYSFVVNPLIQTGSGYFFQAVGFVGSSQSFAFNSGSVSVSNPVKYVDPVDPPGIKRKSNDASSGKTVELGVLAASLVVGQLV